MLLQIANKIQNGALNCEEKLTLAKNTLQAVSLTALSHMFMSPSSCAVMVKVNSGRDPACLGIGCVDALPLGPSGESRGAVPLLSLSLSGCCSPGVRAAGSVESDVTMYIQECEGLIRQLQVDLQILRDENYYQLEELALGEQRGTKQRA